MCFLTIAMHGTLVFLTVCGLTLNWLCDWLTGNGTNTKSRYIAHTYIYILCHTEGSQRFFSLSLSHTHTHTHTHTYTPHISHIHQLTLCQWSASGLVLLVVFHQWDLFAAQGTFHLDVPTEYPANLPS